MITAFPKIKENTGPSKWQVFKEGYKTEARWEKAVQHLREAGELTGTPKDIGALIAEVKRDIVEEEREIIKQFLWNHFGKDVLRVSVGGLPEWYKSKLLEQSFDEDDNQWNKRQEIIDARLDNV